MTHAVVLQVSLVGDADEGMKMLDDVIIPHVSSLEGFQRGTWMHDGQGAGMAVVQFDSEAKAKQAVDAMKPPPGGPGLTDVAVYAVAREA